MFEVENEQQEEFLNVVKTGTKPCCSINNSIFYDNVRVPEAYRLKGPGDDAKFFGAITAGTNWHTGILALGIAQGAFEIAGGYYEFTL